MNRVCRLTVPLLALYVLSSCGGGGSSGTSGTSTPNANYTYSTGSSNVVAISINPGPASAGNQTFNIPYVSVKVCAPGGSPCATIPDVEVDTGSYGLRILSSVLTNAGVTLSPMTDPAGNGNTIQECSPFADGYTWGPVTTAIVSLSGETTSMGGEPSPIPLQVINDSGTGPAVPSGTGSCIGTNENSLNLLDANGLIGVGPFVQDCGSGCVQYNNNDIYYTCNAAGGDSGCSSTSQALDGQVANPVAFFPTDNNGVIVQLPSISAAGATGASGYLVFGIGTETNNGLQGAVILAANDEGNFTTTFDGGSGSGNNSTLGGSFIDSGSNALYFNDSNLPSDCPPNGDDFYCPSSTTSLSAINQSAANQGQNGNTSTVSFQIADLYDINPSYFAINNVGGPAPSIPSFGPYFDWGLPFFYGRTVFFAIDGMSAGGTTGPYYAY